MVDRGAAVRGVALAGLGGMAATAGAVVGFGTERHVMGGVLGVDDPLANEPLGGLRGTPYAVEVGDGVQLHVEIDGDDSPGLSTVFVHGYLLNQDCWHFQRRDLRDVSRLVFYDQRSHGRSGRADRDQTSIERLGSDLGELLETVVPPGPVVLVGHSMGGMTIMALADQQPDVFADRVVGVGLLATSAALVTGEEAGLYGRLTRLINQYGPPAVATAAKQADIIESVRRHGNDLGYILVRRGAFARDDISPSLVEFVSGMLAGTPIGVFADFLPHFGVHDTRAALAAIDSVPSLVMGATRDLVTPVAHSRDMVTVMTDADYVEIPNGGHMLMLEHPDLVTAHLRSLIARSTKGTPHEVEDPGAVPVPLPRLSRRERRARSRRT